MLVSVIYFHTYLRLHTVFNCIKQLQQHTTNSGKFSFHFYSITIFFLIFLIIAS